MTVTDERAVPDEAIAPGAAPPPERPPDRGALRRLLAPVRGAIVVSCILQALSAVAGVVPFIAVAELARVLLASEIDDGRAWRVALIGAAALVVRLVLLLGAGAITHFADNDFQLRLRRDLAAHLGRVPLGWFDERNSGEVKKALQDDVGALHHLVGHSFLNLTAAIVTPVVSIAYLATVNWQLTLIALVPLAVGLGLYQRMMSSHGDQLAAYGTALGRVNAAAVEFVQGIAVVKAFGQANRSHRRFLDEARTFVDFFWSWAKGLLGSSAMAELVLSPLVALLLILASGAAFVGQGWIEPVDVVPFALLGLGLSAPFLTLNYAQQELSVAKASAVRLVALLDVAVLPQVEPTSPSAPAERSVPVDRTVAYEGVRFSYDGETDVLRGIDLVLEPGTVTALVGPSGSGKSTIAKLLPRFWDPSGGRVTLGGVDIRDLPARHLYQRVGFVFQDVQLLRTTVRDNIRLADPAAGDDRVRAVARAAQIHDRILALPRGYDSVIGDDAVLSGGEAQRVSIARALLADAPVLVLDEATAFADPESEAAIQDALSTLAVGRTLLVVAHRLHTVVGADQIVVVEEGAIVERGTHAELLAVGGRYARLWESSERAHDQPLHPEPGAAPRPDADDEEVRS